MSDTLPTTHSPITALRAWVAARALGVSPAAVMPALAPAEQRGLLSTKANPVGALIASMWSTGSVVYTPISFEALAREGVLKNGYIYRAITIIARACAGIPWVLYRDKGTAGATARRIRGTNVNTGKVDDHPLLDLLKSPHGADDIFGTASLVEQLVSYFILSGNTYLTAVGPGRGVDAGNAPTRGRLAPPLELWVLRPDRMRVIPAATGGVGAFRYIVGGKNQDFAPGDVLHWKSWNPSDDWYGLSPVAVAARIIDQMNAANDWNTSLLQNLARPGGFLMAPGQLPDPTFERLRAELTSKYASAKNAGRPQVLEGGLTWQQVGLAPSDMDWLNGKIANVREISVILGVPSEMLGDSTNKTFANFETARKSFYTETVLPLMDVLKGLLNAWLVPMFGDAQLRLDYDRDDIEALQEDRALVWTRAHDAYGGGVLTLNEARDLLGYAATEDGDVFIAPPRAMTLDQLLAGAAFPKPPNPAGIPSVPPAHPPVDAPKPLDAGAGSGSGSRTSGAHGAIDDSADGGAALDDATVKALVRAFVAWRQAAQTLALPGGAQVPQQAAHMQHVKAASASSSRRASSEPPAQREKWVVTLTAEAQAQFTEEHRQLAAILSDTAEPPAQRVARATALTASFQAQWRTLLAAAYTMIGLSAANALYQQWRSAGYLPDTTSYSGPSDDAQDAQDDCVDATAQGIADHTSDRVQATLADALGRAQQPEHEAEAGVVTAALLAALAGLYDQWSASEESRASVIATTETTTAWSMGGADAAQQATDGLTTQDGAAVVAIQTWNSMGDDRVRPTHDDADGQQVLVGESFTVGGEELQYPGDAAGSAENTMNCRCYVTIDFVPASDAVSDADAADLLG